MSFWQFFREGWKGRALLVRPSKMHHSIWKILFLLGADEYLERMEGKIIIAYSFILKYFKITVCCVSVCGRIQFRNGSKITASQLSEALFASYTSLFCLLFFSAHHDRKYLWLKFRRKNIRLSSISRLVR